MEQSQKIADSEDEDKLSITSSPVGTDCRSVKFCRRESQHSFEFVFPNVEEISVVNESSFREKLPSPSSSDQYCAESKP